MTRQLVTIGGGGAVVVSRESWGSSRFPRAEGARLLAAVLAAALLVVFTAGCTNAPPPPSPPPPAQPPGMGLAPAGTPQVTPEPKQLTRLGNDVPVNGRVDLVVDPTADQPARDLAVEVLRAAGATDVTVRQPGPTPPGSALEVRLGSIVAPTTIKTLQSLRFLPPPPGPEGYVLAAGQTDHPIVVIGGADPAGVYYGVQTLRQLTSPGRIAGVGVLDEPKMPTRGVIEGFYGAAWTQAEQLDQIAFYGDVKMNTFVYGPKDDPYHRELWRNPYPPGKLADLRQQIGQAGAHHVRFVFGLSPGTSICYSAPNDWDALVAKLQAMYDLGVRDFAIPLDDISYTSWNCPGDEARYGPPSSSTAGQAQADLLNRVQREFLDRHPGTSPLLTVSTEYSDVDDSPYKSTLRAQLDPRVQVMWTGVGVIPNGITTAQAQQANSVWGRKVMVWDNYPVNDFPKAQGRIMLGPYAKREPGLHDQLAGILVNPMTEATASKVVQMGAADFAWNDLGLNEQGFDPQRSWRAAAEYLAGRRLVPGRPSFAADPSVADALMVLFDLQHMAPLANGRPWLDPAPDMAQRFDRFRAAWNSGNRARAVADLRSYANTLAAAPAKIRAGAPPEFTTDVARWLDATDLWASSLQATVDGLQARVDGDEARAGARFAAAADLAGRAQSVQTDPGKPKAPGPAHVADGVLDVFIRDAPGMR